jgi:hypothetical protein
VCLASAIAHVMDLSIVSGISSQRQVP